RDGVSFCYVIQIERGDITWPTRHRYHHQVAFAIELNHTGIRAFWNRGCSQGVGYRTTRADYGNRLRITGNEIGLGIPYLKVRRPLPVGEWDRKYRWFCNLRIIRNLQS